LLSTIKTIPKASGPSPKKAKYALTPAVVQKWMADHYSEGSDDDLVPKQDIWSDFQKSNGLHEEDKTFF
jgi:hypothetical protein